MRLTIDFETRSDVSMKNVGAWLHSKHPSTHVTAVAWSDGFCIDGQHCERDERTPTELFEAIEEADTIIAHNSFFEVCIWMNVCVAKYGWPEIPIHKWRCSATKAAICSLPRALAKDGHLLKLKVIKDEKEGKTAMQRIARGVGSDADWPKMLKYNKNDVDSEVCLDEALPDLSDQELAVWQMSERMNFRGFMIDKKGCTKAVQLAGEYARRLTDEFQLITGLDTAGQREKFIVWAANQGVTLENTQADTLDGYATTSTNPAFKRACEIVREIGRSSIKKYRACLEHADTDDRVRGSFLYHGAHTGRYSGKDVQPQNFKRDCPYDMERAWQHVIECDLDAIELLYGAPLEFLGSIARGAIVAAPGTRFFAGDYAQIEARKVFWLSGEQKGLDIFRRGEDPYVEMATTIWGKWKCIAGHTEYIKKRCVHCEIMRFVGKHAILGLGFGAGYVTFLIHLRELGAPPFDWKMICEVVPAGWRNATLRWIMTEGWNEVISRIPEATRRDAEELVLAKWIVDKYRSRYKETVVAYWKTAEDACRMALQNPGKTFKAGRLSYTRGDKFLNCKLPSGRMMRYFDPKLDGKRITYIEQTKMFRTDTYGGKLVENGVQASSRDIMTENMLRLEKHEDYKEIVMTIHDEVIAEVPNDCGDIDEFTSILATNPKWCLDLPIKVDGWVGPRYKKG